MKNGVRELPADVWVEILRRIPATHLHPLKAVCKSFHRLISDDFFTRLHLNKLLDYTKATTAIIIISSKDRTTIHPKISNYDPDKRTISVWHDEPSFDYYWPCNHIVTFNRGHCHRVIDSYHGLLLVQICGSLLLCNPITRSYKFISASICNDRHLWWGSGNCFKIAYDDHGQYKVFGLKMTTKRTVSVSLYALDVRRYDRGESYPPREIMALKGGSQITNMSRIKQSVLVNGNVYWLFIGQRQESCIVSANVITEEVKVRSCSSTPLLEGWDYNFFATNGTFYLVRGTYYVNYLQLWVLEGVESENPNPSWKMKHLIPTYCVTSTPTKTCGLGMLGNKILIMFEVKDNRNRLIYQYDISSGEFEKVTVATESNFKRGNSSFEYFHIVEHIDSLISFGAGLRNAAN